MNSKLFPPIPNDTANAARAVFGRNNFYIVVGDQANSLFSGLVLDDPFGRIHKSTIMLAMLYLITIFQFVETLPDHLASEAVRKRVDWKYALHLPLSYLDLEASLFCEFRKWLLADQSSAQKLQLLFSRLIQSTSVAGQQRLSQESSTILNSVCLQSRLAKVWLTASDVLGTLATWQPDWLRAVSLPHWYERYSHHQKSLNLPEEGPEQEALAQAIGADGFYLLKAISEADKPELANLPEVLALKQVWREQYIRHAGKISWRKDACAHCSAITRLGFLME